MLTSSMLVYPTAQEVSEVCAVVGYGELSSEPPGPGSLSVLSSETALRISKQLLAETRFVCQKSFATAGL